MLKVIIDFDGTLTAEETQVEILAEKCLQTLAEEIIRTDLQQLSEDYHRTRRRLLSAPQHYGWRVNGLLASYCDEGAFILNTTTLQEMLRDCERYDQAVGRAFPDAEYDPVAACTNYLFHRHTAEIEPAFRKSARKVLQALIDHPNRSPVILTNSLGDKVCRQLGTLGFDEELPVLGDTRQYDMQPDWRQTFPHPNLGDMQIWPVLPEYPVDLRRPIYYQALRNAQADGSRLAVVADTFSLPGALPLVMDIPFFLVQTPYTPSWCIEAVRSHPQGRVLPDLSSLPAALATL